MKTFVAEMRDGTRGVPHIVEDEFDVNAWAIDEAEAMVAAGYVRVVVTPYVRTRTVGDKRRSGR